MSPQQILTTVMKSIVFEKGTDRAKPHFDLFFITISMSKKMSFFRARSKKAFREPLTQAALSGLLSITAN